MRDGLQVATSGSCMPHATFYAHSGALAGVFPHPQSIKTSLWRLTTEDTLKLSKGTDASAKWLGSNIFGHQDPNPRQTPGQTLIGHTTLSAWAKAWAKVWAKALSFGGIIFGRSPPGAQRRHSNVSVYTPKRLLTEFSRLAPPFLRGPSRALKCFKYLSVKNGDASPHKKLTIYYSEPHTCLHPPTHQA